MFCVTHIYFPTHLFSYLFFVQEIHINPIKVCLVHTSQARSALAAIPNQNFTLIPNLVSEFSETTLKVGSYFKTYFFYRQCHSGQTAKLINDLTKFKLNRFCVSFILERKTTRTAFLAIFKRLRQAQATNGRLRHRPARA